MLPIKGDLAAAIGRGGCRHRRGGRPAAHVHHLDVGDEENAPSSRANRCSEVDVFRVHEESFVEKADRFGIRPSHEQTGA